jgi:hypothetical protein
MRDFRPDDIDGEVVQETHTFHSIYDELLWEVSHDNLSYIDPAIAAKAIMAVVNEKLAAYFHAHRSAVAEFSREMQWLASSLLVDNHEYIETTLDQRKQIVKSFVWADYPTVAIGAIEA